MWTPSSSEEEEVVPDEVPVRVASGGAEGDGVVSPVEPSTESDSSSSGRTTRKRNRDGDGVVGGDNDGPRSAAEFNFLHEVLPDGQAYLADTAGLFSRRGVPFHSHLGDAIHGERFSAHWDEDSTGIKATHNKRRGGGGGGGGDRTPSVPSGYFLPIHWGVVEDVEAPNRGAASRRSKRADGKKLNINQFRKKKLDWMDSRYLEADTLRLLAEFATVVSDAILAKLDVDVAAQPPADRLCAFPMVLKTGHVPHKQGLHVDEKRKLIEAEELRRKGTLLSQGYKLGYTGHTPLGKEGMVLRIVVRDDDKRIATVRYFLIPYGYTLLLRSDVIHSGFFGSPGNSRLHTVHLQNGTSWNDDGVLFVHGTRGYFEAGDYEFFDFTKDVEAADAFKVATPLVPGSVHRAKRPRVDVLEAEHQLNTVGTSGS